MNNNGDKARTTKWYESVLMVVVVNIIVVGGIMVLFISEGSPSMESIDQVEIATPTPTPTFTPTPRPTPVPTPTPTLDPMDVLKRYDYDGNGCLDVDELNDIREIYFIDGLTTEERSAYIEIIGGIPKPTPTPIPTPISTPIPIPTPGKKGFKYVNGNPIPTDYYSDKCFLPSDVTMYEYMDSWGWNDDNQYVENEFDCSQMAAYTEWELENCGYNVVIRVAKVEGEDYRHAWILVEFKEGWLAYECTGCYWVYPSREVATTFVEDESKFYVNPSKYEAGTVYNSIYDIWDEYQYSNGEELFVKEWGWWIN